MNLENVNKRNTREWSFFNENSKAVSNRTKFTEKYGGIFQKTAAGWVWEPKLKKKIEFAHTKKKRNQRLNHKNHKILQQLIKFY